MGKWLPKEISIKNIENGYCKLNNGIWFWKKKRLIFHLLLPCHETVSMVVQNSCDMFIIHSTKNNANILWLTFLHVHISCIRILLQQTLGVPYFVFKFNALKPCFIWYYSSAPLSKSPIYLQDSTCAAERNGIPFLAILFSWSECW